MTFPAAGIRRNFERNRKASELTNRVGWAVWAYSPTVGALTGERRWASTPTLRNPE
jgi:hypothetical protein